ncbi:MAG: sugar MFS transporter [Acidobacteriaceae bacterium]|nr:sugar MFS transporter [Acidobacteriaceae bacterium]
MAISTVTKPAAVITPQGESTNYTAAMAVVTTLFFMWGFITCLNDVLIPHLGNIFDLNYEQRMRVQLVFFSAYAVFGVPSGKVVEWIGYQKTMVLGLLTMALGGFLMVPAANVPSYPLFLVAAVVLATGITALQVAANPYVAVLGKPETASSRLNLTQAFNSLGTTVAPRFGGWLIIGATVLTAVQIAALSPEARQSYRVHEASTVKVPYIGLAIALIVLAAVIGMFELPKLLGDVDTTAIEDPNSKHAIRLWEQRHLILGVVAIFLYVGAEVAIGSFLVNYLNQKEIGNLTLQRAAEYLSYYWGGAMVGRFIGAAILQKLNPGKVLGTAAFVAFLLVLLSMLSFGNVAMWSILAVGLFNSIMFPTIFTLGIAGLGPLTGEGSGLLVMAIVGGAIIPWVQGMFADRIGVHHAFILPLICYLYITYYGLRGSKPKQLVAAA